MMLHGRTQGARFSVPSERRWETCILKTVAIETNVRLQTLLFSEKTSWLLHQVKYVRIFLFLKEQGFIFTRGIPILSLAILPYLKILSSLGPSEYLIHKHVNTHSVTSNCFTLKEMWQWSCDHGSRQQYHLWYHLKATSLTEHWTSLYKVQLKWQFRGNLIKE